MAKRSPSLPPQPDPVATAQAQGAANREAILESARLNQYNIASPFGTRTFTGELGEPDRLLTIGLPDPAQRALEQQQALTGGLSRFGAETLFPQVEQAFQTPIDFSAAPGLPGQFDLSGQPAFAGQIDLSGQPAFAGGLDLSGAPEFPQSIDLSGAPAYGPLSQGLTGEQLLAGGAEQERATYQRAFNMLDPQFQDEERDLETALMTRGFRPGSEAWTREMDNLSRRQDRALTDLSLGAVGAGRAEQSRLLGEQRAQEQLRNALIGQQRAQALQESLSGAGLAQQARQQAVSEQLAAQGLTQQQRQQALSEQLAGQGLTQQQRQQAAQEQALANQIGMGLRQQAISEQLSARAQPINELAALLQGAPAIGSPQFPSPAQYQIQPGDIQGQTNLNYQNQLNLANQAANRQAQTFGNLLGLGGTLAGVFI